MTQGLLLGVTGTHLERTGAELEGPEIEICDACDMPVMYKPAVGPMACRTPEVHTWKDPGADPEEGDVDVETGESMEITPRLADEIAHQVDVVLALDGEGGDDPQALRAAIDAELGHGDFERWPEKRGEQVHFVEQLAVVVLERLGKAVDGPKKRAPTTVSEGFDDDSAAEPIIKLPIGG